MITNKKIAVFGFGKEGVASANYLARSNEVTIIDEKAKKDIDQKFFNLLKAKNVSFFFGHDVPHDIDFDLVVRSPGVKPHNPQIKKLTSKGALLTSATKIFFDLCPCPIIGVTGTKGKGTTSTLIFEMLKTQKPKVFLAGNIGTPVLDILPNLDEESTVVLELSSFQLSDVTKSPHIAVVLMVTSEHLDWHKDTKEYISAKTNIVGNQTKADFAVINLDFESSRSFADKTTAKVYFYSTKGKADIYLEGDQIKSEIEGRQLTIDTKDILLPGKHNLQNIEAATAVAQIEGIDEKNLQRVLKTFKGLPYRLQKIAKIKGVEYYNDSFSTTPETTIAAIQAFKNPKVLILGGSSKNSNFEDLGKAISKDTSIKAIILIGVEGARIKESIEKAGGISAKIIEDSKSMQEIVEKAESAAKKGDIVLLSPACASFGMFKNYQDRGDQFTTAVLKLNGR